MSSPVPSADGDRAKKPLEQITFRFCSECSNMLYPKEDENDHKLMFTCRTCNYSEEATSSCIFRNVLNNAAGETAGVTQDVGSDPTVGAVSVPCDSFLSARRDPEAPAYACCLCCGQIIMCEICGDEFATVRVERNGAAPVPAGASVPPMGLDYTMTDGDDHIDIHLSDPDEDLADLMARTNPYFGAYLGEEEDEGDEPDTSSFMKYASPAPLSCSASYLAAQRAQTSG